MACTLTSPIPAQAKKRKATAEPDTTKSPKEPRVAADDPETPSRNKSVWDLLEEIDEHERHTDIPLLLVAQLMTHPDRGAPAFLEKFFAEQDEPEWLPWIKIKENYDNAAAMLDDPDQWLERLIRDSIRDTYDDGIHAPTLLDELLAQIEAFTEQFPDAAANPALGDAAEAIRNKAYADDDQLDHIIAEGQSDSESDSE